MMTPEELEVRLEEVAAGSAFSVRKELARQLVAEAVAEYIPIVSVPAPKLELLLTPVVVTDESEPEPEPEEEDDEDGN